MNKQDNISPSAMIDERLQKLGIPFSHRELRDRWITLEHNSILHDSILLDVKIVGITMYEIFSNIQLQLEGMESDLEIDSMESGRMRYGSDYKNWKIHWG